MREQVEALEELARVDLGFRQLDVEQDEINARLAELRGDVDRIRDLLQREKDQLAEAERLRTQTLRDIEDIGDRVNRSTARHNAARNNREKEATQRELEVLRREKEERTAKVSELEAVITQVRENIVRHEGDFAKLQEHLAAEEAEQKVKIDDVNRRRGELENVRKTVTVRIRADVLRKYNIIRDRRGTAVAEVSGGICRACHISIPPQLFAKIHAGKEIFQCPNCQRILVLRPTQAPGA